MYKRFFYLLFLIGCLMNSYGQLSVSLHELPGGIIQKNQLWNITMIYSGNTPASVTIGLSLTDLRDNQVVMTAFTKPLLITKGVRQLRTQDVAPIDYNYFSPAFNISILPEAFIPVGNYRACYTFYAGKSGEITLAEDCMPVDVQPLSPPQLNMPSDSTALETFYPQFNWLPPAPLTLFSNLNYDLLVAEIQPGQTAETAIQENLPVYSALHLNGIVNNYPASYKSLDTGKTYAWRVIAKNNETIAAQSEVWTFRIKKREAVALTAASKTFLELTRDNGLLTTGIIPGNTLGIKYYSYDKTHEAVIRFRNSKGDIIKEIYKTIQYGNNFLAFQLDHFFNTETTYFIELNDLQMSRYKTSFRISK